MMFFSGRFKRCAIGSDIEQISTLESLTRVFDVILVSDARMALHLMRVRLKRMTLLLVRLANNDDDNNNNSELRKGIRRHVVRTQHAAIPSADSIVQA